MRQTLSLALGFLLSACTDPVAKPTAEVPPHATAAASVAVPANALLRKVPGSTVCMMNNRFMDAEQIPVVVEGRTYFGCCAMCKDKLGNDPAARTGKDPVSGKAVDKASAIIGVKPNGNVLYFESDTTFAAYRGGEAPAATSVSSAGPSAGPSAGRPAGTAPSASAIAAPVTTPAASRPPSASTTASPKAPTPPPVAPTPPTDPSAHKGH